jgi:hypothetical protein
VTEPEFLSAPEIRTLTGYAGRDAQCSKLDELGVPHRRDGARVLVSRFHARQWLLGEPLKQSRGVDWSAVK